MNTKQNKKENDLIAEAYQQINEWGEDLDPANNPLDALKYRIAEMEGQNPRVTARYAREVVDEILHMGKAVSAEEVEAVLRTEIRSAAGLGGEFNAQGRQERPLFDEELIKYIMTPFEDKHDDGSERHRSSWKSAEQEAVERGEAAARRTPPDRASFAPQQHPDFEPELPER